MKLRSLCLAVALPALVTAPSLASEVAPDGVVATYADIAEAAYGDSVTTAKSLREYAGRTWLLTGDVARMDEDGFFYIVDRKKDLIIASGYNIYPREVEEVLYAHPAVLEAAVVGVPDEYRGETVHAAVVFKEGQSASEKDLIQYCRRHLSPYKAPRSVEVRTELPKTAVGKVLRRELREQTLAARAEAKRAQAASQNEPTHSGPTQSEPKSGERSQS